jgi:hypothetical protein
MAATSESALRSCPLPNSRSSAGANRLVPARSASCSASAPGLARQRDSVARQPGRRRRHAAADRSALPLLPAAPPLFPPGKWYDASLYGLTSGLADGASPSLVL